MHKLLRQCILESSVDIFLNPPYEVRGGLIKSACLSVFRILSFLAPSRVRSTPHDFDNGVFRQMAVWFAYLYAAAPPRVKFAYHNGASRNHRVFGLVGIANKRGFQ